MKFGMIDAGTFSRASPATWSREVTTWSSATAAARTPSAPPFDARWCQEAPHRSQTAERGFLSPSGSRTWCHRVPRGTYPPRVP